MKKEKASSDLSEIIRLLNQSLEIEYSFIVNYPRIANTIKNKNAKEMMITLGEDSMQHADIVADTIKELGGTPSWTFQLLDSVEDLPAILKQQLEKEELAEKLHKQTAAMAPDQELSKKLEELGEAEKGHIIAVKKIMAETA